MLLKTNQNVMKKKITIYINLKKVGFLKSKKKDWTPEEMKNGASKGTPIPLDQQGISCLIHGENINMCNEEVFYDPVTKQAVGAPVRNLEYGTECKQYLEKTWS